MTPSERLFPPTAGAIPATHNWRLVTAASIGNALEWFDLVVYGFFAATIAKLFFPAGDDTMSLLIALGTFGVSFFMRPLGAVVLGIYADRAGRKAALTLSITLMMVGTLLIAAMPTYASIGVLAPIGLTLARLIQGFSAGGEFGSATAFLAEHSPARRGFYSSFQVASQGLTTLLAALFGAVLTSALAPEQMTAWGWRVPFFFGLCIGPVAYYIRRHTTETPAFLQAQPSEAPLQEALGSNGARIVYGIGAVILATVATYLVLYMPSHAVRQLHLPPRVAFSAAVVTGLVQMIASPIAGHLSDRIGRIALMRIGAIALLVLVYPAFLLLQTHPVEGALWLVQAVLGLLLALYFAPLPALLAELFPTRTRTTGMSLAYNLAATLFGGFAPFIITWLIATTGNPLAPAFYVMGAALISSAALWVIARRRWLMRDLAD